MTHYTYLWLREDGTPYYAGKGRNNRAFTSKGRRVHCPADSSRIITQEWPTEGAALAAERLLIGAYGRMDQGTGCLRNLTDGGGGAPNPSDEARRKMSAALIGNRRWVGRKHTDATKRKISLANKGLNVGRVHDSEFRQKMRDRSKGNSNNLGRKHSPEARRRMGEAHRGIKQSIESRRKRSEKLKGRTFSDDSRRRMSIAHLGNNNCLDRVLSAETKQRIAESQRTRLARKRAATA